MISTVQHIKKKCFISIPYPSLKANLAEVIDADIQPEIGLEGDILYTEPENDFAQTARALDRAGLQCTLHAPFFDLNPGALDRVIRQASRDKLQRAFDLISIFRPASIVCHLGYEDNKHSYKQREWLKFSIDTWNILLETAAKFHTIFCLENTYESNPEMHRSVLWELDSEYARFCLDVGHLAAFAKCRWQDWLPDMDAWLGQLHLHDNHGDRDNHLAIGEGSFDFAALFGYLKKNNISPLMTLEPHHQGGMEKSLLALNNFNYFN